MSLYEDRTYENLMAEMRADVSSDIDQQEGSFIDLVLGKQAVRLEEAYENLDYIHENMLCDTQDREHLIESGAEAGQPIYEGTEAEVLVVINCEVPEGTVLSAIDSEYNYATAEMIGRKDIQSVDDDGEPITLSYYTYRAVAEDTGIEPGSYRGEIEPSDFLDDFDDGWIEDVLVPGKDEEDIEGYRERRLQWFQTKACAGNRAYYKEILHELENVGGVKIKRRLPGSTYIEVCIQDAAYKAASEEIIAAVKNAVDPEEYSGEGYGLAPIGHEVNITTVKAVTVNVSAALVLELIEYEDIKSQVEAACEKYLAELRERWEDETNLIIRKSAIETRILEIQGVHDAAVTINGQAKNVELTENEIPILGTIEGR